jgi:hypothetical protein
MWCKSAVNLALNSRAMARVSGDRGVSCVGREVCRPRTVETHIRQIFLKLGLRDTPAYHRRVVAVLTFLRSN